MSELFEVLLEQQRKIELFTFNRHFFFEVSPSDWDFTQLFPYEFIIFTQMHLISRKIYQTYHEIYSSMSS
jgi:hypothetical protein